MKKAAEFISADRYPLPSATAQQCRLLLRKSSVGVDVGGGTTSRVMVTIRRSKFGGFRL